MVASPITPIILLMHYYKREVSIILATTYNNELQDKYKGIEIYNLFYKIAFHLINRYQSLSTEKTFQTFIRRLIKIFEFPINVLECIIIAKRENVKLVHFQTIHLIEMMLVVAFKIFGLKTIYTIHNVFPGHKKISIVQRLLYVICYKFCDRIIIHSKASREDAINIYSINPHKIKVIPHGDYNNFLPSVSVDKKEAKKKLVISHTCKTILFFGAIRDNKGLDYLLDAMAQVKKTMRESILMIVGEPLQSYSRYQNKIHNLKLDKNVYEKLEYINNEEIPTYFLAADVVVLPYLEISQSGVLHLAYAFSKPVIATSIGGFKETIENGKNGYLIPPKRSDKLTEKLIDLLTDNKKIEQMGNYSHELSKKYS